MSFSNSFETDLLQHIFQNGSCASVGDGGGLLPSAAAGSAWLSLHTADPGDAGYQVTSEVAYTNYVRVAVSRAAASWAVSGASAFNIPVVSFAQCGATSAAAVYVGVGSASTGSGLLYLSGSLAASLAVTNGVTPSFAASALNFVLD